MDQVWIASFCQTPYLHFSRCDLRQPLILGLLAERVNEFASRMPSLFAGIDGDTVVDKPRPNGALHLVDAIIERLAVLH